MISYYNVVIRSSIILVVATIAAFFLGMNALLPGFLLGMVLGTANFLFLESSVTSIFAANSAGTGENMAFKLLRNYFLKAIFKFVGLALIVFVFIIYVKISWIGLLAGFMATIIVFISEVLKVKKCR